MFTPREQQIIDLWGKLATAFNTITNEGNTWTITGGDYPDGPQFDSKEELIECIETDIKGRFCTILLQCAYIGKWILCRGRKILRHIGRGQSLCGISQSGNNRKG